MIRLIALDVDGTLIGAHPEIHAETAAALRDAVAAGVFVTLATARSYFSARKIAAELGLNAPLIVHAGALVRDPATDQIIFERPLPVEYAVAVSAFCDDLRLPMNLSLGDHTYLRSAEPLASFPRHVLTPERIAPHVTAAPLSLIVHGIGPAEQVRQRFESPLAGRVRFSYALNGDGSSMLTLTAAGADKGAALAALCAALNVPRAETMAVGDSEVDLPMFAVAGVPVAMGNASSEIQRLARIVAPHVDDLGVADVIRRYVLGDTPIQPSPAAAGEGPFEVGPV
ncbi:MAG: HAD family hydrolase [Dehalococcoidia bacterium]